MNLCDLVTSYNIENFYFPKVKDLTDLSWLHRFLIYNYNTEGIVEGMLNPDNNEMHLSRKIMGQSHLSLPVRKRPAAKSYCVQG